MIDWSQGRSDREDARWRHQDCRIDPGRGRWAARLMRPQGGRPRHLGQGQRQAGMALGHDAAAHVGRALGRRAGSGVGGRVGGRIGSRLGRDAVVSVRRPVGRPDGGGVAGGSLGSGGFDACRRVRAGRPGARRELAHRRPGKGDRQNQRQAEQHVPDPGEGHLARHSIGPAFLPASTSGLQEQREPPIVVSNVAPFCPRSGRRAVNSRQKN